VIATSSVRILLQLCVASWILGYTGPVEAQPSRATLRASLTAGERGYVQVTLVNEGLEPVRLMDAREGSAACGAIWKIEVRMDDGRVVAPAMRYSPGDPPRIVTIAPGESYERVLQAGAYLENPPKQTGRATVIVHYEVQEPFRQWDGLEPRDLRFSTQSLELDVSQLFGYAIGAAATGAPADADVLRAVARDLEALGSEFPQLREFSSTAQFDTRSMRIGYSFRTHAPPKTGGWTSGVPEPDDDGVWFSIDIHDPASTLQLHTQPMTTALCLGDKRVSFLLREGRKTKSLYGPIWKVLAHHGVRECGR
jgi:hypothetical protein